MPTDRIGDLGSARLRSEAHNGSQDLNLADLVAAAGLPIDDLVYTGTASIAATAMTPSRELVSTVAPMPFARRLRP
jgi:hypothetical protein